MAHLQGINLPPKYAPNSNATIPDELIFLLMQSYPSNLIRRDVTELIYRKFYLDFVLFGYSTDIVKNYLESSYAINDTVAGTSSSGLAP